MTIIEEISAIVETLPQKQATEILIFAELIRSQHLKANQPINSSETSISWKELVYSLAGTWEDFPPLEDLRTDMGEDIFRESF